MIIKNSISYLYVALGGALGAVSRFYLSSLVASLNLSYIYYDKFPLPIIFINIIGCFIMGVCSELMGVHIPTSYNLRLFLITGLLGGFTTFSAFSLEFALLWQKHLYATAISYALLSFLFSIIAFFLGVKIIKFIY